MNKYKLENGINFYDKLMQSMDDESDDDEFLCKISGFPLNDKMVTLECNHKFNYEPLFKEICKQKFDFKSYEYHLLSKDEMLKIRKMKKDYFIKCPYCRNIQFSIIPYYEEYGFDKIFGVNSLDPLCYGYKKHFSNIYGSDDYEINMYGVVFKKGICNEVDDNFICKSKYVAFIPNTEFSYCTFHYKKAVRKYNKNEKNKKLEEKAKLKEEILMKRKKLFEEKNLERAEKGLPPLKNLPSLKKEKENVVIQSIEIQEYIPEVENEVILTCKGILKSRINKGKQCECKKIFKDGFCKRHFSNNNDKINLK
uniref:Uncharacterized protein n=1 Tax=viral metagenome TaxID=1070528 RepID=A0A6C0KQC7_9ZZZZ